MSDSTLKELWQQVAEKKSCEAKQKELTAQRDTLADRLKKLEKSKLAEQADVDRLEGHSLATFFYQVIGKMDEKLDKERQEAYAARVKYDVALHDLSSVDADLAQIQNRLARLSDCERQYQAALSEKIKSIKASEIKRGKYTSVKGARQKRFIRFKTLGAGYSEEEIKAVLAGRAKHHPHQKQPPKEQTFQLLVDIQAKLAEGKGGGYERWAKKHNLKEMSKTLIFLQQQKISSADELKERADAALSRYHELGDSIKTSEKRLAEIAVLKAHIINYAKTRPVYDAYRKAGYSKKFLEEHCTEITLHKAAKAAFDESNLKTLPKIKELDAEYSKLLTEKKARYPDYRKARDEMQELLRAQKNIELFFDEEKDPKQTEHSR